MFQKNHCRENVAKKGRREGGMEEGKKRNRKMEQKKQIVGKQLIWIEDMETFFVLFFQLFFKFEIIFKNLQGDVHIFI